MPETRPASYTSPSLERRYVPAVAGYGVFARQAIHKGDLLCVWGGKIVDRAGLEELPSDLHQIAIQVEEDLFLAPSEPLGEGEFINHSCDPNAGLSGQIALVARREIASGEEITFDYAMSDGSDYDEFACECGAPTCRKKVTGSDWRIPELQTRYKGFFSPYLQRRIDAQSSAK
jgi:uncharacterized protein